MRSSRATSRRACRSVQAVGGHASDRIQLNLHPHARPAATGRPLGQRASAPLAPWRLPRAASTGSASGERPQVGLPSGLCGLQALRAVAALGPCPAQREAQAQLGEPEQQVAPFGLQAWLSGPGAHSARRAQPRGSRRPLGQARVLVQLRSRHLEGTSGNHGQRHLFSGRLAELSSPLKGKRADLCENPWSN